MATTYRTFKRSARNWEEFANSTKFTDKRGLSLKEARERCEQWNADRTAAQIQRGTKLEFEQD